MPISFFNTLSRQEGIVCAVPESHYDEAMGALPPVTEGCPLVDNSTMRGLGEVYTFENGVPVYYWYARIGGLYYGVLATAENAQKAFAAYVTGLIDHH